MTHTLHWKTFNKTRKPLKRTAFKHKQARETPVKRHRLNAKSKAPSSIIKDRIQALLRAYAIKRDKHCVLTDLQKPTCSGWDKAGNLVLQYDHLITRSNSATYSNEKLGVLICRGHHGWKKWHKEAYDQAIKRVLKPGIIALWEAEEAKRIAGSTTHFTTSEWILEETRLKNLIH